MSMSLVPSSIQRDDGWPEHLEAMEMKTKPHSSWVNTEQVNHWRTRASMLEHLLHIHEQLQLLPDTLFLAMNLFDRYCSKIVLFESSFELACITALLIAAKYLDLKHSIPSPYQLLRFCHTTYNKLMVHRMEQHMLQTLDWTIGLPLLPAFLTLKMTSITTDPLLDNALGYASGLTLYHERLIESIVKELRLLPNTHFLAVHVFDRYCSKTTLPEDNLELACITALLIAVKYLGQDQSTPTPHQLFRFCHTAYHESMIQQVEEHILQTLEWIVGVPGLPPQLLSEEANTTADPLLTHVTGYIAEMTLFHQQFITIRSSIVARAAINLAHHFLRANISHTPESIVADHCVICDMIDYLSYPPSALFAKYEASRYLSASRWVKIILQRERSIRTCSNS